MSVAASTPGDSAGTRLPRNDTFSLLNAEEGATSDARAVRPAFAALQMMPGNRPSLQLAAARLEEAYATAITYASTAHQLAQPPPKDNVLPVFVPESAYAWREDMALASMDNALASV